MALQPFRKITPYIITLFETIDLTLSEQNQQRELFEFLKSIPRRFLKGKITINFGKFTFGFSRFLQHLGKLDSEEVDQITFAGCRFSDKSNDAWQSMTIGGPSYLSQSLQ